MDFIEKIKSVGGHPYFVGGCVRDSILKIPSKDIDIEVFGISINTLVEILKEYGKVDCVGQSFGVVKFVCKASGREYDFSLPRRENKVGVGHKGFDVQTDERMTIEEAAERRDFTFNAISKEVDTGRIVDPFNGIHDLASGILRHTSNKFSEDSLRVLRGMQFCGRFELLAAPSTLTLCRLMKKGFNFLSKERVWGEFEKWAMKSVNPKLGLDFLAQSGWVDCFPELRNILGCPQEYKWHPEGCVYSHTTYVCNAMNEICHREKITGERKLVLMLSALCHDLGKANTTAFNKGRITSYNHDVTGVDLTQSFLLSIKCPKDIIKRVLPLVRYHMVHRQGISESMVRRLSKRIVPASIEDLALLIEADYSGRPPLEKGLPEKALEMLVIARWLGVNNAPPKMILTGKALSGIIPEGKDMGDLLRWAYEKQLKGCFSDLEGALEYIKKHQIFHKYKK